MINSFIEMNRVLNIRSEPIYWPICKGYHHWHFVCVCVERWEKGKIIILMKTINQQLLETDKKK